jgi:hypothetical protein
VVVEVALVVHLQQGEAVDAGPNRFDGSGVLEAQCRTDTHPPQARQSVADATPLSDPERAKLEQRRDRLMKLMKEGDGSGVPLDAEDRADLAEEWNKIDRLLQGSR